MVYTNIKAGLLDLALYRGDKTAFEVSFFEDEEKTIPYDLTAFAGSLKMQVKTNKNNARAVDELLEGTGLTVTTNTLLIETAGLNISDPATILYYDVEGLNAGARTTILAGNILLTEDVTR